MKAEREVAARVAREAGAILMQHYGSARVSWKGRNDPVTQADQAANDYIVERLRREFPGDGILAEETADDRTRLDKARCWIVDPLDGTREFIAQNGEFVVMIGLAIGGEARLGVVYQPVGDALYVGVAGEGAEMIRGGGAHTPLGVSAPADVGPRGLRAAVSRSHTDRTTGRILDALGVRERLPMGSVGLKVALLLEGKADVYVAAYGKASEWDVCAPEAILRAAGGRLTDLFGDRIVHNRPDPRIRRGLCATNGAVHDDVVAVAAPFAKKAGLE